jgi:hypothetical protein
MEDDNTTTPTPSDRPLGYWLRAVDARISERFAQTFAAEGIGRREWMLLSVLAGDVDAPGFAERLARRGKKLRSLRERGWVTEEEGTWTLTDEGRAAKERLSESVRAIREEVSGAVTPEEFATTMTSLEAIARRLGWDEQNAHAFGRHGFGPRAHRFGGAGHGFGRGGRFGHDRDRGHDHGHGHGFGGERDYGHGHGRGFRGEPGFGGERDFGHGHGRHHGHGFGGERGSDERGFASHGGRGCGERGRSSARAEGAFERGFRAGFAARAADAPAA